MRRYTIDEINGKLPNNSKLKALREDGAKVIFKCECGIEKSIRPSHVYMGTTLSCGCYRAKDMNKSKRKYGEYNKSLYSIWERMISRCHNPKDKAFKYYGAKSISVCNEWRYDFMEFNKWALLNGWNKGLQIDKDIHGRGRDYSPQNCKWVSSKENNNNRSSCKFYDYYGEIINLTQICKKEDVEYFFVRDVMRLKKKNIYQAIILAKSNF